MNTKTVLFIPGPSPLNPDPRQKYDFLIRSHDNLLGLLISNPAFKPNLPLNSTASLPPSKAAVAYPSVLNKQTFLFEFVRRTRTILSRLDPEKPDADNQLWDEINARAVYVQMVLDDEGGLVDLVVDGKMKGKGTVEGTEEKLEEWGRARKDTDCRVTGNGFTGGEIEAGRVLAGGR
ncbi:MAG: hypothetical protein M1828_002546 [Chrysothrix sp. TS-e1954]|nr:MAG: hypothetical protein M1828_002546 [Chrysothrix sp. TS-e1954]